MATRSIIPVGRLQVATPSTMAAAIRADSEATKAVDERVSGVAAGIIANDPTVAAAARQAASDQVAAQIVAANLPRAYPEEPVAYTALAAVPMRWTFKTLNDPYADAYADVEQGTWQGTTQRRGDVAVLSEAGKLAPSTIPDQFVTADTVTASIRAALAALPPAPVVPPAPVDVPVFRARVAQAWTLALPVAGVFVGSSTTAADPGYIALFAAELQALLFPVAAPTAPQWSPTATFVERTEPGIHAYSAGKSGAKSNDYLTDAECQRIAALKPAFILHMVGANDFTSQVAPATYKANLLARVQYLNGLLTVPCQHLFVHSYDRLEYTAPTYQSSAYRDALHEVADATPAGVFIDLSPAYVANGVPGSDPLDLISADNVHQSETGYRFMADLLARDLAI